MGAAYFLGFLFFLVMVGTILSRFGRKAKHNYVRQTLKILSTLLFGLPVSYVTFLTCDFAAASLHVKLSPGVYFCAVNILGAFCYGLYQVYANGLKQPANRRARIGKFLRFLLYLNIFCLPFPIVLSLFP